eukprot:3241462-Rhodomonas_salina.1
MERIQRLLHFGSGFERSATQDEWVLGSPGASPSSDLYLRCVEARSYEFDDHVLAATDGSVRQSDGRMGAGASTTVLSAGKLPP